MSLLFLLVGLVAADYYPAFSPMGMTRRSLYTSDSECASQVAACNADPDCVTCFNEFESKGESGTCSEGAGTCDDAQAFYCCTLADEDEDCENDFAFGEYLGG